MKLKVPPHWSDRHGIDDLTGYIVGFNTAPVASKKPRPRRVDCEQLARDLVETLG